MNLKIITRIAIIFAILIPIAMVGIFLDTFGLEFLSGTSTYNGNGVSFYYPSDYNITQVNDNSTFLVGQNIKDPNLSFQISRSPVNGSFYNGTNLDAYAQNFQKDIESRGFLVILADNTTTHVDNGTHGVPVYSIYYDEKLLSRADPNSLNGHIMIFDKNGTRYTINFLDKGKESNDRWAYLVMMFRFRVA